MSHMARESAEAPDAVARFLELNNSTLIELGKRLQTFRPQTILPSARGSSDTAAGYFKYLTEILTGVPCCSIVPSVFSVYGLKLQVKDGFCLNISQPG